MIKQFLPQINTQIKLVLFAIIATALLTYQFGYLLTIHLSGFFILGLLTISSTVNEDNKYITRKKSLILLYIAYPFLELTIKIFVIFNIIPYSWAWFNRLEHIVYTTFITYMFFVLFKNKNIGSNNLFNLVISFLFVNTLGIVNEILEFFIRIVLLSNNYLEVINKWNIYYTDTMMDLITNFVAALLIISLISIKNGHTRSFSNQ